MIKHVKLNEQVYEVRVGTAVLATIYYDKPLLSRRKLGKWLARSTFLHREGGRFGDSFDSLQEAQKSMEDMINMLGRSIIG